MTSTKNVVFAAGAVSKYAIRNPVDGVVGTAIPVTMKPWISLEIEIQTLQPTSHYRPRGQQHSLLLEW